MDVFRKNILEFPSQLSTKGLIASNLEKLKNKKFDGVIITGMGGSGLAGEILKGVQKEIGGNEFSELPIIIWKDYGLPDNPASRRLKNPLHIFVSFSGNTEEILSGLKILLKTKNLKLKTAGIAIITSGGELAKMAEEKKLPAVFFSPGTLTPRQATGKMFYGLVKIFQAGYKLQVSPFVKLRSENYENFGRVLAQKLKNKIIAIYTDQVRHYLGYIWKIKFNETAKNPAFNNVLPEMNHNEIVGFGKSVSPFAAIFLKEKNIHERVQKRFKLTEKLLKKRGVSVFEMELRGKDELEKTWRTIISADWTSYFLAKINRVNPTETEVINKLKSSMKK